MDRPDRKNIKGKKYPRVPIKTYKWEDIRRSRKRGGYPWTHLYKQPFNEELDPEPYAMEALTKSKSSSTLEKSEGVEICEITSETRKDSLGAFLDVPEKMDTLQIITDPDDHSMKNSTSSLVIEECEMSEAESQKPENMTLESAESSDNISQYLDKDERCPDKELDTKEISRLNESNDNKTDDEKPDAIPEEEPKRKRKLSAESSYSRISLTKQALLKKLRDTKNKIKVPKLSFPTSKLKRPVPKKTKSSPPETKKNKISISETKKVNTKQQLQSQKVKDPVYIHIPLKPPSGETDEFSYLEFEEIPDKKSQQPKKLGSFKDIVRNIKQLQETNLESEQTKDEKISAITSPTTESKIEIKENDNLKEKGITSELKENTENLPSLKSEEKLQETDNSLNNEQDLKDINPLNDETAEEKTEIGKKSILPSEINKDEETTLHEEVESKVKESVEVTEEEIDTTPMDENKEDIFEKLFQAGASSTKEEATQIQEEKRVRSKSAEPEKRRKLSLESSYSRKSLSKLGILKKLKDASDKIKQTLSRTSSKKETKPIKPVEKKEPKIKKQQAKPKDVKPVYIHIPLKPPDGTTDEFSYLEFDEKKAPQNPEERNRISSSPDSPRQSDVQFIMLTAPSDDEILDYHSSDAPETPSSENKSFFSGKIDELKELAKDVVDEITPRLTPPPILKKLDPVTEETNSDKVNIEETSSLNKSDECIIEDKSETNENEKIIVDVEDGLNESVRKQDIKIVDPATETKEDVTKVEPIELKSNLKDETSPVIKKKVSFKRRSKTPKDGIYEDIQAPKEVSMDAGKCEVDQKRKELSKLEASQSLSVGEEKAYLDDKIIKTASLDEDYNKWSKISDHEYEPVNPPPDTETFPSPMPTVHITDTEKESSNVQPIDRIISDTTISKEEMVKDGLSHETKPIFFLHTETDRNSPTSDSPFDSNKQTQEPLPPVNEKTKEGPSKFQIAFKQKTDQFKSKLHNIKKPHITMPDRSKLRKMKFEKPVFNIPKIPDTTKINLPSFSFPRRNAAKRSLKERQQSTESNAGDSKKPIFDFSTYPRIFKKKSKTKNHQNEDVPDFVTAPRSSRNPNPTAGDTWTKTVTVTTTTVIPLHSEESVDTESTEPVEAHEESQEKYDDNREDSVERRMSSHIRYDEDIDIDDGYERDNNEIDRDNYLNRWNHGNFNPDPNQDYIQNYKNSEYKVTDLDSPEDIPDQRYDYNTNNNKENYSSGSSLGGQRVGGVLEEINPDEFFLRQKGISQDDIEVGMYLSSEIREAFRMPENALSKMQDNYEHNFNIRGSNQSLPEANKRKPPIKKPKRKKTPHASQEQFPYVEESGDDELDVLPPSRPKRRSKRVRKPKNSNDVIPYQETISLDTHNPDERLLYHRESLGILGDDEREAESNITYENEKMEGIEQPEIQITDPYKQFDFVNLNQYPHSLNGKEEFQENPSVPPRKHKSLKSLTSENDSILGDISLNQYIPELETKISTTELDSVPQTEPPQRPTRVRSHSTLHKKETTQPDDESLFHRTESLTSENQVPCVEEPCVQDIRDYMGYAIIDKQKVRDPPLPPPRTPPRRKRSIKSTKSLTPENKFFTVPRPARNESTPVRPLRNYSTLGQTRKNNEPAIYENKENIDITQYIEVDDEPNRDLQSGEVIKKMKDRPLPAPPRPPRKSRPLRDITSKENISEPKKDSEKNLEESEMSTQTEPLPDDLVCEEITQEVSDTTFSPSNLKESKESPVIEKRLITPSYFTHEETITHGSLIVQPLDGSRILPDSELTSDSKERIIPITPESDDDGTSSIPEDFKELKDPLPNTKTNAKSQLIEPNSNTEIDILKTQKLRVSDLDVDTLTVNKLLAGKIVVSEIDSSNISTNEISSKSGALKVGEIELPPGIIQQILKSITSIEGQSIGREHEEEAAKCQEENSVLNEEDPKQKKNAD